MRNKSFDEGDRILIKAALNKEAREGLKELIVLAKRKGKRSIQIAKVVGDENVDAAYVYTFIWDSAPAGVYDLSLKIMLQDGKLRFSEKVSIVVR